MTHTVGDIIAKYIEIRDHKKALEAAHKTKVAELDTALDKLANVLQMMQQAQGVTQFKVADVGTAFQKTSTRVALQDRAAVIQFVRDYDAFDIFTNAVSKSFVEEFIEKNKAPPPGIAVEYITEVQVRKA